VRTGPAEVDRLGRSGLGVLLGSGLGGACEAFATEATVRFDAVPDLEPAAIAGHAGEFRRCVVATRPCLFICGRKHAYEGVPSQIHTLIATIARLGVRELIVTSAAGSLTPAIRPSELVLVRSVIDLQFRRPSRHEGAAVIGTCVERPGGRPLEPDTALCDSLRHAARNMRLPLAEATLASVAGPTYETPGEVVALRRMGASLASMSGAPELAAALGFGIRVAIVVLVTNWATGISRSSLDHGDVVAAGGRESATFADLIAEFVGAQ
jgi:inosine/guanosine/xanthosine phosphorylase family protein